MSAQCEKVDRFADGELEPAAAEDFRRHLAGCQSCPTVLEQILVLDALAEQALGAPAPLPRTLEMDAAQGARYDARLAAEVPAVAARPAPAPLDEAKAPAVDPTAPPARKRLGWLRGWRLPALVFPTVALGAVAAGTLIRVVSTPSPMLALAPPACRSTAGRVAYQDFAQPVPCRVTRAAADASRPPPIKHEVLAALEARGDYHGLAVAYLADGDLDGAATFLARAPVTPQLENDRAVLALERGDAATALATSERLLAAHPDDAAAAWNRAAALAQLGRRQEAAAAFATIAARNEPGWSEEARRQATALAPQ